MEGAARTDKDESLLFLKFVKEASGSSRQEPNPKWRNCLDHHVSREFSCSLVSVGYFKESWVRWCGIEAAARTISIGEETKGHFFAKFDVPTEVQITSQLK